MPAYPDRAAASTQLQLADALSRIDSLLSERTALEERLARVTEAAAAAQRFACHDELTGLPNRRLLLDRFAQAAARGMRGNYQLAALLLDLDGFKRVNDTFGHSVGDRLLQQVAERLVLSIRSSDTACRLGGDEFLVLLQDVDEEGARRAGAKIRTDLGMPYRIDELAIDITTSLGTAICPLAGETLQSLMHRADGAMYRDKARRPPPARSES